MFSADTLKEIRNLINGGGHLPPEYADFVLKWLVFNRAYNEVETAKQEAERVINFANRFESHWAEVEDLAKALVSLECIGSDHDPVTSILKPNTWTKTATHYLRKELGLSQTIDAENCQFAGCERLEKRQLCNQVPVQNWDRGNVAALIRLVYQVRCNLVHGEKRLYGRQYQTNRDEKLIVWCSSIMTRVLHWLADGAMEV